MMKNKLLVIIGILFLFASVSAFVVNIQGDLNTFNPGTGLIIIQPISVSPSEVPRYCDVTVSTSPSTLVKVYKANNVYTGISCTTDSTGMCKFRFGSNDVRGTYYARANTLQAEVKLEPGMACPADISEFNLSPDTAGVQAGVAYVFTTYARDKTGKQLMLTPTFSISNSTVGRISTGGSLAGNQVMFIGNKTGTARIYAQYGPLQDYSEVTVSPGVCNTISLSSEPLVSYRAGANAVFKVEAKDVFGNPKGNVWVYLKYTSPSGQVQTLSKKSDSDGSVQFTLAVGERAGAGKVEIYPEDGALMCQHSKSISYFTVSPDYPHTIMVAPASAEANVRGTVPFRAVVYDRFMNEISGAEVFWRSSNDAVAAVASNGVATAHYPGTATITALHDYSITGYRWVCYGQYCFYTPYTEVNTVSGTAQMVVRTGAPATVVVSPATFDIAAGGQHQFTATVYDVHGAEISNPQVTWSTNAGTISANGLFTAQQAVGEGTVTATSNGASGQASVRILPGAPAFINAYVAQADVPVNDLAGMYAEVTDRFGNPVQGASVEYAIISGPAAVEASPAPTNANGIAVGLARAGLAEGTAFFSARVAGTSITDVGTFNVYIPDSIINGMVDDTRGRPIEGAHIVIEGTQFEAYSGQDGRFTIGGLNLEGTYTIIASAQGHADAQIQREMRRNTVDSFSVSLVPYTQITVTVFDGTGVRLQGAEVGLTQGGTPVGSCITGAQGTAQFTVEFPTYMQYTAEASAAGYLPETVNFDAWAGDDVQVTVNMGEHDITPPEIYFMGATPADGSHISGAIDISTVASDRNYHRTSIMFGSDTLATCTAFTCTVNVDTAQYVDGEYLINATASDTHGHSASVTRIVYVDNTPPQVAFVSPTPDEGTQHELPFIVNASADDATGIVRMAIEVNGVEVEECISSVCTHTIDTSLYSGMITVRAVAESALNTAFTEREFEVIGPSSVPTVLLISATPGVITVGGASTITATLLDQNGDPMEGYDVQFTSSGGSIAPAEEATNAQGVAQSVFSSNDEGVFQVSAQVGALTNSTGVTVNLVEESGALAGTVTNATGDAVEGALVEVMKSHVVLFTTTTNSTGRYSIDLPADTYDVVVTYAGYLPAREYSVFVQQGQETVRNYVLTKMSRLHGEVMNETGSTIGSATLKAYRNGALVSTVQSGAGGQYEFIVPSGVYMVEATHPDYVRALYTAYVPPAGEAVRDVIMYR